MPIIIPISGGSSGSSSNTSAGTVISRVQLDLQSRLPYDTTTLLEYVNRVQMDILKISRWKFLISAPQYFITEKGQTSYWVGSTLSVPTGVVDTGLNLTDLEIVKEGSVFDRSNFRDLAKTDEAPLLSRLGFADASSRPGRPLLWRNAVDTPGVIDIYPASDNQNTFRPVPEIPYVTVSAGGSLPARTYFVRTALVDSAGNTSSASDETQFYLPANTVATVRSPSSEGFKAASGITYSNFNVYIGTTSNSETQQNLTLQTVGTDWTEPVSGLVAGALYPTTNTLEPMRGYLIEFRYFKQRQILTDTASLVQIPDMYIPVLVHGIDALMSVVLKREDATLWQGLYKEGITSIIRDKNLFPKGDSYIQPDSASVGKLIGGTDPSATIPGLV